MGQSLEEKSDELTKLMTREMGKLLKPEVQLCMAICEYTAENVTGSAKLLSRIFEEAGLPEHLFTVLIIDHDHSNKIIDHDLRRGVTLTGSPETGEHVAKKAEVKLKKRFWNWAATMPIWFLEDAHINRTI